MSLSKQEHSQMIVARGVALMLVGLVMWLWVRGHSPHMGYAEMLADMDNWILKEPFYSVVVVISALFALSGGIQLYRGLRLEPNLDSGTDNTPQIFCSECGTRCSANTAFCNKCGCKIGGA